VSFEDSSKFNDYLDYRDNNGAEKVYENKFYNKTLNKAQ
jgi:hypothetical protein